MKRLIILTLVILSSAVLVYTSRHHKGDSYNPSVNGDIALHRQEGNRVPFFLRTEGYILKITEEKILLEKISNDSTHSGKYPNMKTAGIIFSDSNPNHQVQRFGPETGGVGSQIGMKGKCSERDVQNIIIYKNIYRHIDLKVCVMLNSISYQWDVKPGADPHRIRFKYRGIRQAAVDNKGNLVVETKWGDLVQEKPVAFQMIEQNKVGVLSEFRAFGSNTYGFFANRYDRDYAMTIQHSAGWSR